MNNKLTKLTIIILFLTFSSCQFFKKSGHNNAELDYIGEIFLKGKEIESLSISPDASRLVYTSKNRFEHESPQVYMLDIKSKIEARMNFQSGKSIKPFFFDNNTIVFSSNTDFLKEKPDQIYKLGEDRFNIYEVDFKKNLSRLTTGSSNDIAYLKTTESLYYTRGDFFKKSNNDFTRTQLNIGVAEFDSIENVFITNNLLFVTAKKSQQLILLKQNNTDLIQVKNFSVVKSFYDEYSKLLFLLTEDRKKINFYNLKEDCIGQLNIVSLKKEDHILDFALDVKQQIGYFFIKTDTEPTLYRSSFKSEGLLCSPRLK